MKKNLRTVASLWSILLVAIAITTSCQSKKSEKKPNAETASVVITENLRFCESTYPYDGGILIANFGTEQLNPLNNEGKGYIVYAKDGKSDVLIPADGSLSGPKGMFIKNDYLFICDVNKIVVYNLKSLKEAPQIISFPEGDLFVNDLAAAGNTLYASVTNTGRIYTLDISNLTQMAQVTPVKWMDIVGPNGLILNNGIMYIASYPADGNTTEANAIYRVSDLSNPLPEKFVATPSQYDGIALSADQKTMYVTDWSPAIYSIDMQTREMTPLTVDRKMAGPADITVVGDEMYIPDLPNSQVICISLNN